MSYAATKVPDATAPAAISAEEIVHGKPLQHAVPAPGTQVSPGKTVQVADLDGQGDYEVMIPSRVADYDYPNVPETTEPQQAATGPGQGETVHSNISFKDQVNGYAKKIAGTVFNNKEEKKFGEAKLNGEA